jgi:hypothetical protein
MIKHSPDHAERAPMTDLAAIAASLTKAQREAIMHRNAGGCSYRWAGLRTIEALYARKLVGRLASHGAFYSPQTAIDWPLTPTGLAVRQHLHDAAHLQQNGEGVGNG